MAASAVVPPVRGQHALQEQDSTSPVSRGVEDLRMEGVVVQAGSYRQSRRGKNLPGQCHQAVGEGESVAFGERQHVLGGVFWHCAPRDLDTGLPGAFLHQRLVPGRPLPRTSNRKENERRLPPSSTEAPRIEPSAAPSSTNESPPTLDPASTPQGVFARRRWPPIWAAAPRRATSFANPREIEVYCCLHPARITDSQRN
jgi:hypothetical protein